MEGNATAHHGRLGRVGGPGTDGTAGSAIGCGGPGPGGQGVHPRVARRSESMWCDRCLQSHDGYGYLLTRCQILPSFPSTPTLSVWLTTPASFAHCGSHFQVG